ncbi:hypothetical protein vseg_009719 [Gypsophila vaccaria]
MGEYEFEKGERVEVSIEEEGFRGAWFTARIKSKSGNKVSVQYEQLLSSTGREALVETVDLIQIRPIPPIEHLHDRVFKLDDDVDAFYNDGWWEGVVTHIHAVKDEADDVAVYSVYFRPTREQSQFPASLLRVHREWSGGLNWVPPLEAFVLREGARVEVSSDEDGFEGAWFAANLVEVVDNDKFVVEYCDIMTDDHSGLVKEEVDSLHIRPCPPTTTPDKLKLKLKLYDEVDALYNDAWWVGIITKLLPASKYQVYFRTTAEQMVFHLHQLRPHLDWANGKWLLASKALNLSR